MFLAFAEFWGVMPPIRIMGIYFGDMFWNPEQTSKVNFEFLNSLEQTNLVCLAFAEFWGDMALISIMGI